MKQLDPLATILVTALVGGITGLLVFAGMKWGSANPGTPPEAGKMEVEIPGAADGPNPVPSGPKEDRVLPGMHECKTTKAGLRLKVVTAQPNLRCLTDVKNGELVGEELPLFQELFVLDVVPATGRPEWYLVSKSPRKAHKIGYLRAETVAEWPTRLGVRPIRPVLFYAEFGQAQELAKTGRTSADPIGRATPDTERNYLPWPIVSSRTITNSNGQVVEVFQLNFLGQRQVGGDVGHSITRTAHYTEAQKEDLTQAVSVITLAFCVDNTYSTTPFVQQIVQFIESITKLVRENRPKLQLALTLYRDNVPGLTWDGAITKTLWNGRPQPMDVFLKEVRPITAPTVGSDDWAECGFQGLMDLLNKTQWPKLSHKVIVWVGDNSSHPKNSRKNSQVGPEDIIRVAKSKGVTIHAVAIQGGGGPAEQALHVDQCRQIAEATGGRLYSLADAQGLANEITHAVGREHAIVRKNRQDLENIAGGKLTVAEYLASKDREELNRRYQFVRLLNSAHIDLAGFAPDQPTFVQGWVPSQVPGGQPLFERMVYLSRVELDVLLSELNHLVALLRHDSAQGVLETFEVGFGSRVGDQSFFSRRRAGDVPFDVFMAARGIPMRTGISMKTRDELLAMSPEEKLLLKARLINEVIPNLTNARSSTAFTLMGDFDFGWIPENLLP